jgi:ParB-like chromosome segregation protein Spo0J
LSTENNQNPNYSETSNPIEEDKTLESESVEQTQTQIEFVNPSILISRQTPSEMSGSKVKRLKKKMREIGFDNSKPIDVANIDDKWIILDGHHRCAAAKQLRLKTVAIVRREVSPLEAEKLLQEAAEVEIYRQD